MHEATQSQVSCDHPLRDGPCVMDKDHRGRHTTVAFYCDGCGKTRRGRPQAEHEDVSLCFMCVMQIGRSKSWTI